MKGKMDIRKESVVTYNISCLRTAKVSGAYLF